MVCPFGDRDHFKVFSTAVTFLSPLLPSPWPEHGSLLSVRGGAALRMELSVRWILRDAEDRPYPRETKAGFYAFGG